MLNQDTQRLVFQFIGLVFIVVALGRLPDALAFLPHVDPLALSYFFPALGRLLQLGVGLWLVLRPARWAAFFERFRQH